MQFQTTYSRKNNQERRICFPHTLLFAISCFLIFSGCDDSFEPLQENNRYNFNISGYLDAAADTQWIRIGTIRESIDEPPDPTGIEVTLGHVQSGETVVMNDSVFTSKNFLNYWTKMDIEHEQTYRITVKGVDGRASRVTVTTPKKLPLPYIVTGGPPAGAYIIINETVEHIADVQSVWYVILNPETENRRRVYRFPIRSTLRPTTAYSGGNTAFANWEKEGEQIEHSVGAAEIEIAFRQFFVAAGGPEWNDSLSTIYDLEYFLDGTASNVKNGLGYTVGIHSAWYRQSDCLTPNGSKHIPCEPEEPYWK